MSDTSETTSRSSLGIIGFGAFGQFMARHLSPYFRLLAYDPGAVVCQPDLGSVTLTDLATAAACDVVVLATPVSCMEDMASAIAPHLRPGALVLDVGSVKVVPARIMERRLPPHVHIIATHPLFGPQSGRNGIAGLKIAVCPVRGQATQRVAAFLRGALKLNVLITTPDTHDREAASVQGLTHLIGKLVAGMGPLPRIMTTRSFELLMEAVDMVRHDAPSVFEAIERSNPYVSEVRARFFDLAAALDEELSTDPGSDASGAAHACPVALQQDGEYASKAVRRIFQQTTLVLHSPHACSATQIAEQGEIP